MLSKQFFSLFIHHASIAVTQIMRQFFDFVAFMWSAFDMYYDYYDCVRVCVFFPRYLFAARVDFAKVNKIYADNNEFSHQLHAHTHTNNRKTVSKLIKCDRICTNIHIILVSFVQPPKCFNIDSIAIAIAKSLFAHALECDRKWENLTTAKNHVEFDSPLSPSPLPEIEHWYTLRKWFVSFYDLHLPHSSISNEWLH